MSSYTKTTNFAAKDTLATGNANKIIRGADIGSEFDNLATAVNSKADKASPTFTGTVTLANLTLSGALTGGAINGGTY